MSTSSNYQQIILQDFSIGDLNSKVSWGNTGFLVELGYRNERYKVEVDKRRYTSGVLSREKLIIANL